MKKLVFSMFDSASGAFLNPFFCLTDEEAVRSLSKCVMQDDHPFAQNPEHFSLHCLGEFDVLTGEVRGTRTRMVAQALQIFATERQRMQELYGVQLDLPTANPEVEFANGTGEVNNATP